MKLFIYEVLLPVALILMAIIGCTVFFKAGIDYQSKCTADGRKEVTESWYFIDFPVITEVSELCKPEVVLNLNKKLN